MEETFTTAFQRRHAYDPARAGARAWLFGIATNLVGRHRRAEARRWSSATATSPNSTRCDPEGCRKFRYWWARKVIFRSGILLAVAVPGSGKSQ